MKKIILPSILLLTLASCGPKVAEIEEQAETIEFPNDAVKNGYVLYSSNCGKCHGLKNVTDYSREEWDKILPNMAKKARLEPTQEATIDEYINWELNR